MSISNVMICDEEKLNFCINLVPSPPPSQTKGRLLGDLRTPHLKWRPSASFVDLHHLKKRPLGTFVAHPPPPFPEMAPFRRLRRPPAYTSALRAPSRTPNPTYVYSLDVRAVRKKTISLYREVDFKTNVRLHFWTDFLNFVCAHSIEKVRIAWAWLIHQSKALFFEFWHQKKIN